MRIAIGANRSRLLAQTLTEGVLLALLGGFGGVLLAKWLLFLMRAFLIHALSRGADIYISWTVLSASLLVSVITSLAASFLPALRLSSIDPNSVLKSGRNVGTQRSQYRLRSVFIIVQVALTFVLLIVSGLLMRSLMNYRHIDLGFDPTHILKVNIAVAQGDYQNRDVLTGFYQPLLDRIGTIPGVRAAGLITLMPIESYGSNEEVHITGQPPYPTNLEMVSELRYVTPGYFDAMGISLKGGRWLSSSLDQEGSSSFGQNGNKAGTIVVNQAFVKKFIPAGVDAIGQHIDDSDTPENKTRIIGITSNVRQNIDEEPMAEMDFLVNEMPLKERIGIFKQLVLVVRADGDPRQVIPALRKAVHDTDPTVPFDNPEVMTEIVSDTIVLQRMESWLFGIFAMLALVLALVGLYGLIGNEVEQSARDIGVRMALGATRTSILAMVLRRVFWMLGTGVAVGLILIVVAQKLIGMVIYFDTQKEAGSFLLIALLLVVAGLLAALIPATRAATMEPMEALRGE
jgi:predicted permease